MDILGLPNLGLTCWLNSILQSLLNCNIFRKEISKEINRNEIIIAFKCIMSPKYVLSGLRLLLNILKDDIEIGIQQDCIYGLICIIEKLCKVKRSINIKDSYDQYLKEWFKTSCDKDNDQYKYSNYYTLFFSQVTFKSKDNDIRYDPIFTFNLIYSKNVSNSLLNYFNTLSQNSSTNYTVSILSPILIFTLNNTKELTDFNYEEVINLKDTMSLEYDLKYSFKSAIIHIGNERGGHYISILLIKNKWILCDDNNIREIDKDELVNYRPFVLFYEF